MARPGRSTIGDLERNLSDARRRAERQAEETLRQRRTSFEDGHAQRPSSRDREGEDRRTREHEERRRQHTNGGHRHRSSPPSSPPSPPSGPSDRRRRSESRGAHGKRQKRSRMAKLALAGVVGFGLGYFVAKSRSKRELDAYEADDEGLDDFDDEEEEEERRSSRRGRRRRRWDSEYDYYSSSRDRDLGYNGYESRSRSRSRSVSRYDRRLEYKRPSSLCGDRIGSGIYRIRRPSEVTLERCWKY